MRNQMTRPRLAWWLGAGSLALMAAGPTLLLFPDGRLPTGRWRPLAWLILFLAVTLPLEGAVSPGPLQFFPDLENPLGVTGGWPGWSWSPSRWPTPSA